MDCVWVFQAGWDSFASGVFTSYDLASAWIAQHGLTGVLTSYPLDSGVYDWAIENGLFSPQRPEQREPAFISRFTSASMEHYHFENGVRE
jgi:hypothetical protein